MIGSTRVTILGVIVLLLCCNGVPAEMNIANLCLLVDSGTLVGSADDCSTYYQCEGSTYNTLTCPSGQYFNKESQGCSASADVTCYAVSSSNPCQGKAIGTWAANTATCGGWYYCSATGALSGSCPTGQNFDPVAQICTYASNYPCSIAESASSVSSASSAISSASITIIININICFFIPNGRYFGDPMACNGWNYCLNNYRHSGNCPDGLFYIVDKQYCSYRSQTNCDQVTDDDSLLGNNNSTSCTAGSSKAATACDQYYSCSSSGSWVLTTCASGYYYDTVTFTCKARAQAKNDCDRCVDTTMGFVNAYSTTGCQNYLVCKNGVEIGNNTCPTGYYFNEALKGCSATEPNFGCCNPNCNSDGVCSESTTTTTTSAPSYRTSIVYITDAPKTTASSNVTLTSTSTTEASNATTTTTAATTTTTTAKDC